MLERYTDIYYIKNIDLLVRIKEELKNDIKDPTLKWEKRMELYEVIKKINLWIEELKNRHPFLQ